MNRQNIEKLSYLHLVLVGLAAGFCLYAVITTFSGMTKDALNKDEYITKQRLANVNTALDTDSVYAKQNDGLENEGLKQVRLATEVSSNLTEPESNDNTVNHEGSTLLSDVDNVPLTDIQKTVVMLDKNGVLLGKVCFEAESEDVFMSYGWRGLASKAIYYKNKKVDVDDIKIEVNNGCNQDALEGGIAVKLVHNPLAIPVSENIF